MGTLQKVDNSLRPPSELAERCLPIMQQNENEDNLWRAAQAGDLNKVKVLVEEKGHDINAVDGWGSTPLWLATMRGHVAVMSYLMQRGSRWIPIEGPSVRHALTFNQKSRRWMDRRANSGLLFSQKIDPTTSRASKLKAKNQAIRASQLRRAETTKTSECKHSTCCSGHATQDPTMSCIVPVSYSSTNPRAVKPGSALRHKQSVWELQNGRGATETLLSLMCTPEFCDKDLEVVNVKSNETKRPVHLEFTLWDMIRKMEDTIGLLGADCTDEQGFLSDCGSDFDMCSLSDAGSDWEIWGNDVFTVEDTSTLCCNSSD